MEKMGEGNWTWVIEYEMPQDDASEIVNIKVRTEWQAWYLHKVLRELGRKVIVVKKRDEVG